VCNGVDVDNDKPTKNPVKHVRFDVSDGDDDHLTTMRRIKRTFSSG
jgi:hypothetical protein